MKVFNRLRAWLGFTLGVLGTFVIALTTIVLGGFYRMVIDWWLPISNPFRHAPRIWGVYIRYVVFGWIKGGRIEEHGDLPVLQKGGLIPLVANHFTSEESPLFVWYIYSRLKMRTMVILKKEYRWKPMGFWTWAVGAAIFIDRGDPDASRASIAREIAKAKKLGETLAIVSFPDGTRPTREKIGPRSKRLRLRYLTDPKSGGTNKAVNDISTDGMPVTVIKTAAFTIPRETTFPLGPSLRQHISAMMHTHQVYHIWSRTCKFRPNNLAETRDGLNYFWREIDDMITHLTDAG